MIGLSFDQFWDMTVYEFGCACRGYSKRMYAQRQTQAVFTRHLMGCWVKHPPSVNSMLGAKSLMGMSKEQISEHYAEKKRGG